MDDDISDWLAQVEAFWEAFDDNDAPQMLDGMRALVALRPPDDAIALSEWGAAPAGFLALALHSAGRSDAALRVALTALAAHLPRYGRSLGAYSRELTRDA